MFPKAMKDRRRDTLMEAAEKMIWVSRSWFRLRMECQKQSIYQALPCLLLQMVDRLFSPKVTRPSKTIKISQGGAQCGDEARNDVVLNNQQINADFTCKVFVWWLRVQSAVGLSFPISYS